MHFYTLSPFVNSLRLIRVRRVRIFFYDLSIKFRSVRLELAIPTARCRINPSLYRRSRKQQEQAAS
jgi:hypothetical protein